ncbi:hypothetical protein THAOC_07608, partial [Thalassiosira oceanica]
SYHVGVLACLFKQGLVPDPRLDPPAEAMPFITGVSAGSMVAAATFAGVEPAEDGMNVVLEAARKTRELTASKQTRLPITISLDVFTPGFSLIDIVEGYFREVLAKSLGGYCETDQGNKNIRDVDPGLFARRFPKGRLRIGLTDRRELLLPLPLPVSRQLSSSYKYVDEFRDLEDVVSCAMLSSYIPGVTGQFNVQIPPRMTNLSNSESATGDRSDVSIRSGLRLEEMEREGLVKHGTSGEPVSNSAGACQTNQISNYWDGGIADLFPTFDGNTIVVTPLSGRFHTNPAICPELLPPSGMGHKPVTFRHCAKSELGLTSGNALSVMQMIFSSSDEELISKFKEGYDDASRFLREQGGSKVLTI